MILRYSKWSKAEIPGLSEQLQTPVDSIWSWTFIQTNIQITAFLRELPYRMGATLGITILVIMESR